MDPMGIQFLERKRLTQLETKQRKAAAVAQEREKVMLVSLFINILYMF
jgi:hypothetical protein